MLLVAEVLFAIWFYRAENSTERSIAGVTIAAVFVLLILFTLRMNSNSGKRKCKNTRSRLNNRVVFKPNLRGVFFDSYSHIVISKNVLTV